MKGLKKNRDFRQVYRRGKSFANRNLVFYVLYTGEETRIGFSISKKVANAVGRNTIKRRLREISRLNAYQIKNGYDIICIVRVRSKNADYHTLNAAFMNLVKRAGIREEKDNEQAYDKNSKVLPESFIS